MPWAIQVGEVVFNCTFHLFVAQASVRHDRISLVYVLLRDIFLGKSFISEKIQIKITSNISSTYPYVENKPLTKRLCCRVVVKVADLFVFVGLPLSYLAQDRLCHFMPPVCLL